MATVTLKKIVWKSRKSEFPNQRILNPVPGAPYTVEHPLTVNVVRDQGIISQEGDQWAPDPMDEFQGNIGTAITALDKKIDDDILSSYNTLNTRITTEKNTLNSAIALKANIVSPALTGMPTVPTAAAGTNTTQAASTAFVITADLNMRPIRTTVTITTSNWETVMDSGQTVYRKTTGVTGNATDLPILSMPSGQIKQLTSSPSLVNVDGTIYIYSAQIPNISLTVTVTKLQTR